MTINRAIENYFREFPNGENVIDRQRLAIAMIDRLRDIRPKVDTGGDKDFIVHCEEFKISKKDVEVILNI